MAALSADRSTVRRGGDRLARPVAAGAKIFAGALVCLNATGFAVPGATATTLKAQGRANQGVDNTGGADGALTVEVHPGIFRWDNSSAGDAIAQADIGANCYVVDDHTVAKTSGTSSRSVCGAIIDVDASGVWVATGSNVYPL